MDQANLSSPLPPHGRCWDFNRLFQASAKGRRGFEGTVKATWVNIAFSYRGLSKLVGDEVDQFADEAFRDSAKRSGADWVVGGQDSEVDIVVIIAADDPMDLRCGRSTCERLTFKPLTGKPPEACTWSSNKEAPHETA